MVLYPINFILQKITTYQTLLDRYLTEVRQLTKFKQHRWHTRTVISFNEISHSREFLQKHLERFSMEIRRTSVGIGVKISAFKVTYKVINQWTRIKFDWSNVTGVCEFNHSSDGMSLKKSTVKGLGIRMGNSGNVTYQFL